MSSRGIGRPLGLGRNSLNEFVETNNYLEETRSCQYLT